MWKSFIWKLVGLSRMLPITFQRNPTQISRCKKFFFGKSLLSYRMQYGVYMLIFFENYWFFKHVKKVLNKNWGVGRDRLYLVSSVVWAKELFSVTICFFHKTAKWPLFALINVHIGFRLKSWLSSHLPPENLPVPREIDSRWLMMIPAGAWACLRE